ncbi:ferrochelatase [Arthrobacter globiformis]|nr:ferrochelatase [Arthrobacter globiformis]
MSPLDPQEDAVNAVAKTGRLAPKEYDGVLLASFGGPEGQDDVIPFLRNVTRGRGIPDERLEEVSHHYRANGGISPINQQNRELKAALEAELAARGIDLPVLWGNRNWDPYIPQTLQDAYDAGHRRLLMLTTSAYSCYSSCRQYREDIGMALTETGLDGRLEVDKVRQYFDHPGFVEPFIAGTAEGVAEVRAQLAAAGKPDAPIHVLFATHSIPTRDAVAAGRSEDEPREFAEDSAYVAQHLANGAEIMRRVEADSGLSAPWSLVYQSRSGAPHIPWLETGHQRCHRGLSQAGRRGHRDCAPGLCQRPHGGGLGPRH